MITSRKLRTAAFASAMAAAATGESFASVTALSNFDGTDTTLTLSFNGAYTLADGNNGAKAPGGIIRWDAAGAAAENFTGMFDGTAIVIDTLAGPVGNFEQGSLTFDGTGRFLELAFFENNEGSPINSITGGEIAVRFAGEIPALNLPDTLTLTTGTFNGAGSSDLTVDVVPEPSSSILVLSGVLGFALRRKRQ